ncbi:MAG: UDP-N-acetylmuramate dehydrogenase [bacterium]|nr:UDP-N-acetylmuramate dehydrogenase [bacterium]
MTNSIFFELEQILGKNRVEINKNIFQYISLRTTTIAEYFFEANTKDDLQNARKITNKLKIPFILLGGGTNLAILHSQLKGLVVKNSYINKEIIEETNKTITLLVSSGYPVSKLVQESVESGMEGLEYHKGLPGSVGGAVAMNSKWTKHYSYFSDTLFFAYIMDDLGNIRKVDKSYFQFAYDYSIVQNTKEVIIDVAFKCNKMNSDVLIKRAKETQEYRSYTQPHGNATCGCFFKNISKKDQERLRLPTTSAGYLIDQSGLKNFQIGNFSVSEIHANFIINKGDGHLKDLVQLINIIKIKVKDKFGVELEEEVKII